MRIALVTPAPSGSHVGNRVTAERWARRLRELDHEVEIFETWRGEPADLLVAVHARKSFPSVERFARERPGAPIVVALAGTDLYADLPAGDPSARAALDLADRLVVLQPAAVGSLPEAARAKARVIRQSAEPPSTSRPKDPVRFEACALAHLRPVKDPFLAARAVRLLPAGSRVVVLHAGGALDPEMAEAARAEAAANPRWQWLGELAPEVAGTLLSGCRLLLVTSKMEGGANVVVEALAAGVPVLSTAVEGSIGQLGAGYPGLFPVGDAPALAALLHRTETEPAFLAELTSWCESLRSETAPEREREAWRGLVGEMGG
ncbi:MAG TPA: selenoneine biosynthesis selenosugar synthase SenB [Thermoanaerobaculia bacterium]|nr:selenoneine biosynthesis selenosugar synthase SenB [Thermoanaerobaculia bacterium]